MVWSLVHSEDEIQATQSPFNANWDLIHCKPSTDPKSILHQSNANRVSKWGHSKLDNPVQQQFSNQLILPNPCRYRPIRANPHQSMHYPNTCQFWTISCQSLTNLRPFLQFFTDSLTHQSSNLCSSFAIHANPVPIQRQFLIPTQFSNLPIPATPFQSMPIHANPSQSSANPVPFTRTFV